MEGVSFQTEPPKREEPLVSLQLLDFAYTAEPRLESSVKQEDPFSHLEDDEGFDEFTEAKPAEELEAETMKEEAKTITDDEEDGFTGWADPEPTPEARPESAQHELELDDDTSKHDQPFQIEEPAKPVRPQIELTENNLLSGFMSEFGLSNTPPVSHHQPE